MRCDKKGVLTGCDSNHEWMLKWWWDHYRASNSFPVTFIDFGMSLSAKLWCQKRGGLVSVSKSWTTSPPENASLYACAKRAVWLSKPEALLKSPYQTTIWIDIDAKVKKSLSPLFAICPRDTIALCPEIDFRANAERRANLIPEKAISYNTGVIVYPKTVPLLLEWVKASKRCRALGDQDLLSRLIFEKNVSVKVFPKTFHRIYPHSDDQDVVIYHYASKIGQTALLEDLFLQRNM